MNAQRCIFTLAVLPFCVSSGLAEDSLRWRVDAAFTYSHFKQQVKAEVGDPRGERLSYDLQSETGDTTGTFDLLPSVAFFGGLGVAVPFGEQLALVVRFEYRLRYYKGREGRAFQGKFEHGTQKITPFIGVSWKW